MPMPNEDHSHIEYVSDVPSVKASPKLPISRGRLATDLDAAGNRLTNLPHPLSDNDVATKSYVDSETAKVAPAFPRVEAVEGRALALESRTTNIETRVGQIESSASSAGDVNVIESIKIDSESITPVSKAVTIPNASTSAKGVVKLNDTTNSSKTDEAATANAVRQAYAQASAAYNYANSAYNIANTARNSATSVRDSLSTYVSTYLATEISGTVTFTGDRPRIRSNGSFSMMLRVGSTGIRVSSSIMAGWSGYDPLTGMYLTGNPSECFSDTAKRLLWEDPMSPSVMYGRNSFCELYLGDTLRFSIDVLDPNGMYPLTVVASPNIRLSYDFPYSSWQVFWEWYDEYTNASVEPIITFSPNISGDFLDLYISCAGGYFQNRALTFSPGYDSPFAYGNCIHGSTNPFDPDYDDMGMNFWTPCLDSPLATLTDIEAFRASL